MPKGHSKLKLYNDPEIESQLLSDANRAHDARYGFQLDLRTVETGQHHAPVFNRLTYPPYLPAVPGFVNGVTTDDEVREWNARWLEAHIEQQGVKR